MLKRKIYSTLQEFYQQSNRALLITGARQVGKTFTIRQFGKENFENFVEINFIDMPQATSLVANAQGKKDLLLRLSGLVDEPLAKGKTLIFFDEVQECPEIVTAIKFLVEEGSYRYILSGSLLGVEMHDIRSIPVGYMGIQEMFPLDFEEFASALGMANTVLETIRSAWQNRTPVDDFIHQRLIQLFRLYLVVGGMPNVVNTYLETNDLQKVMNVQREIITLYKKDIAKYDYAHKLRIEEIFNLIPPELNAKNKRFILKSLNEHAKFERLEEGFIWLKEAGVALPVYNAEEPKVPLLLSRSRNLFKLFLNDVGLLAAQYADGIQLRIINGDSDINYGSIYENIVAQELLAHGFDLYYYNNKKKGELDFLIEMNGIIIPVEVKSGKHYERHHALSNVLDCPDYYLPEALVLCNDNLKRESRITYVPIYMIMFIAKEQPSTLVYHFDMMGLK